MIDKHNTVVLLDNDSVLGKVVRLIMDRNCEPRKGYDFHQHSSGSTYFPGSNDKKFLLIGNIFNLSFIEDIKRKDSEPMAIYFNEEDETLKPLEVLSKLWIDTSNGINITEQEASVLQHIARIFEKNGLSTPQAEVMRCYIENFVNIITNGKDFFTTSYTHFENTVAYYKDRDKQTNNFTETLINDEKKFFESDTYQIVLNFKGNDLEKVLLNFYKQYPDLKDKFNLIHPVTNNEDISRIMEQKLLLESMHLANAEYYNKCIKQNNTNNIVNQSLLGEIITFIGKIRNRLVFKRYKNGTD